MRFLALLLLSWLCLYGADAVPSEKDTLASSLFTANDATVSGSCSYGCRAVASGYVTQIVDIDAKSGTTQCEVYSVNDLSKALGVNANQTNTTCQEQNNRTPDQYNGQLVSSNTESSYKLAGATYDTGTITFSRFLAGMCTLDPDIINFSTTSSTGILSLKNPGSIYGTNVSTLNASKEKELVASADSLNKSNLAYFANLFSSMSTIYSYLQNLLFAFVSAFFVVMIGSQKLQAYLENKQSNISYLSKLYVPIIAVAFFYVPIPQENNMHSSIMQNIIRNFMGTSTKVADKAAVLGANTYLQKLYSSVGANTMSGEATIYSIRDSAKAQAAFYNTALSECKSRFPDAMTFQVSDADLAQKSIYNYNQVQEGITAQGCRAVERKYLVQSKVYVQHKAYAEQINKSFANNQLQSKLTQINTYLNNRQTELGWVNSILMPSAAISIQLMPLVQEAAEQAQISAGDNEKKINDSYKEDEDKSFWQTIKERGQNYIGQLVGKVAYMILPGANTIYEFGRDAIKHGADVFGSVLAFSGNVGGAAVSLVANNGGAQIGGLIFTATVLDYILDFLPLIASVVAGILAILGWMIELTKYFYVTPFVVAFAVTMRRVDKMVEFLVTGIAIFFKPTLLVMFIFLGLFLYWLSKDVLLAFGYEQFNLLNSMNQGFIVSMLLNIVVVLLKIVSSIASTYFLWKLILTGPSYTMRLIGIDRAGEYTNLIQAAAQKLDQYSVKL